ncbi:dimethylarginine dimethylaminohydrolase family protein [Pectinatus sottacetonis]|uniref:dimethylarginine dimethylaminohydrolase family protein n=1 Tax=Pectinatus sottacetonis TaxID=1002795 RepID=UPI0018C7D569|nr:arginine deiminase family protein [Pectinatus sottacetonis]
MFVKNSSGVLKKVLMSRPTYLQAAPINEIAKQWSRTKLSRDIMEKEHLAMVKAYEDNGVETILLDADEKRPNSTFSRDFGCCLREGYVLGNFREPIRFLEREAYRNRMEELGIPLIAEVKEGLFEGGDFTFLDDNTLAIGMVARTNTKGIEEIKAGISKYGYEVVPVPCDESYLHLDLLFNLVDEKLALVYQKALPADFLQLLKKKGIETINVPDEKVFHLGCNVEALGNKRVISLKSNEYVNTQLDKRGIKVIEVDINEIVKAGGGPHCMTFPLLRK